MPSKKVLLLISAGSFFLFICLSYLVHTGMFTQFDFDTTVKFQDHLPRLFDLPFSLISLLGSAEVTSLIWVIILIVMFFKKHRKIALALFLFPLSQLIEIYGKTFVYHPAPPFLFYRGDLPFSFPSSYVHTNYSYPSGHVTRLTFLVVFTLIFLNLRFSGTKRLLINLGLVIFLFVVYISRIYLAEHWTTDVLGGALLGASLGILPALVDKYSRPRIVCTRPD